MSVKARAIELINGERQKQYGPAKESFARIARFWNAYLDNRRGPLEGKDVAALMILFKLARLQGPEYSPDSVVDIIGYGELLHNLMDAKGEK